MTSEREQGDTRTPQNIFLIRRTIQEHFFWRQWNKFRRCTMSQRKCITILLNSQCSTNKKQCRWLKKSMRSHGKSKCLLQDFFGIICVISYNAFSPVKYKYKTHYAYKTQRS